MAKPKGTSKRSPRTKRANHVIKMITPIGKKSKINKKRPGFKKLALKHINSSLFKVISQISTPRSTFNNSEFIQLIFKRISF